MLAITPIISSTMTTIRRQIRKYYPHRLELIHETPHTLTFQRGSLPRAKAIKKAWIDYLEALVFFFLPVAAFFSPLPKLLQGLLGNDMTLVPPSAYWVGLAVIIIPTCYAAFFRPCFAIWTFDKSTRQIQRIITNGLGIELSTYFNFNEVVDIEVSQYWAGEKKKHYYCWLVLNSGYRIFLSHCKTGVDRRSKNLMLYHHLVLAEKMRGLLSLYTPPSQRADRIGVPLKRSDDPEDF
jgi:hypothetical protein